MKLSIPRIKQPQVFYCILGLALLLYGTAVRDGHNWGGDFSQYILHAQNLINGLSYTDLGYVNKTYAQIGPRGYPPGYPLSIVPVLYLFGLNFIVLKLVVILFLVFGLYVYYHYARFFLSTTWALGCLAFLTFAPWMLKFSNNVLSDIPYMSF